jgi:SAM-dependent methyltransferase
MNQINNVYADKIRAESYAKLEFPGTYYLAYRDLPDIIGKEGLGRKALDFGCGTGRSTRFLKNLGWDVSGIDISAEMIRKARQFDPNGDYWTIADGDFTVLPPQSFDLILSVFTFDNISSVDHRIYLLRGLRDLLKRGGKLIMLDSTPEIYTNEWASFSTKDFPGNKYARSGEPVKIILKDVEDIRPVTDIIWYEEDYDYSFQKSGLTVSDIHYPLGNKNDSIEWVNETKIAPWVIYTLSKKSLQKKFR